jgi:hypothetical protein
MHVFDFLSRFWDKLAPLLGLLVFLLKLLTFFFRKKFDGDPPKSWSPRGYTRPPSAGWNTPPRTRFPSRWSVNDLPRP